MTLDQLSRNQSAKITHIDWPAMSEAEGQRLRALGVDEGVDVKTLFRGIFLFRDPIAVRVGRMTIALRRAHAAAVSIEPLAGILRR